VTADNVPRSAVGLPTGALCRWIAVTVLSATAVLVAVLLFGGGTVRGGIAGLPDAGRLTAWALPASRLMSDTAGVFTIGFLLAAALFTSSRNGALTLTGVRLGRLAAGSAGLWGLGAAAGLVLSLSDILGWPVPEVLDPTVLARYVFDIPQGRALAVQAFLALIVAGCAWWILTTRGATGLLLIAVVALLPPAMTGHTSSSSSHELAVSSLLIHLVAVALWVGGLAGLLAVAVMDRRSLPAATPRFSLLAAWCFAVVAGSGVANAAARLSSIGQLVDSRYGLLVLGKATALLLLGGFGWWHRTRTLPTLLGARAAAAFVRIAAVELTFMISTFALAVGLSRTPTPSPTSNAPEPSAAGVFPSELPAAPTPARLLSAVHPDGFFLTALALAAAAYALGLLTMRRRGDAWPMGRTMSWFAGLAVVGYATTGGLGVYASVLFSAHMVQHMVLNMVAPILLVLGAPTTLALRTLRPGSAGQRGPREWLLAAVHSRLAHVLTRPPVAAAIFLASLYGLYFSPLFTTLMASYWGHLAMQAHFLAAGALFFWVLIGVDPGPKRPPHPLRLLVLLLTMSAHAFFGITIMSSSSGILAGEFFASLRRPWAADLLADQHLGGAIAWAMGEVPSLCVALALLVQWLRADEREARRFDRRAARLLSVGADDDLARYNRMLAALHQRTFRGR